MYPSSWLETKESAGWERVAPEVLMGIVAQDGTSVGDADVELVGLVTDVRIAILMFEHLAGGLVDNLDSVCQPLHRHSFYKSLICYTYSRP